MRQASARTAPGFPADATRTDGCPRVEVSLDRFDNAAIKVEAEVVAGGEVGQPLVADARMSRQSISSMTASSIRCPHCRRARSAVVASHRSSQVSLDRRSGFVGASPRWRNQSETTPGLVITTGLPPFLVLNPGSGRRRYRGRDNSGPRCTGCQRGPSMLSRLKSHVSTDRRWDRRQPPPSGVSLLLRQW